jgi:hypothetical protein
MLAGFLESEGVDFTPRSVANLVRVMLVGCWTIVGAACISPVSAETLTAIARQPASTAPRWCARTGAAESASFRVVGAASPEDAVRLAEDCERLRTRFASEWLDANADKTKDGFAPWRPRCDVVVHEAESGYLRAVGVAGRRTRGSSLVQFQGADISARRIDLLRTTDGSATNALPHEMVHLVLADRFGDTPPPRWAEEGIAVLADPPAKRAGHDRDLLAAHSRGRLPRIASLLASQEYPANNDRAAFYGQSARLVRLLLGQGPPRELCQFIDAARSDGTEAALRGVYNLNGFAELERLWQAELRTLATSERSTAVRSVAYEHSSSAGR